MNEEQFKIIAELLRTREPSITAARLVILNGESNADAARAAGVLPSSSYRSVRSFMAAHAKLQKAYGH